MDPLEEILAAPDLQVRAVEIPEWGLTRHIRTLPSIRRDEFDRAADLENPSLNFRARVVAYALCDAAGKFLCGDPEATAAGLGQKSAAAIGRLFKAAAELNGLRDEDIEDTKKKSPGPAGDAVQAPPGEGTGQDLPGAG